jgi:hypothetical protein
MESIFDEKLFAETLSFNNNNSIMNIIAANQFHQILSILAGHNVTLPQIQAP